MSIDFKRIRSGLRSFGRFPELLRCASQSPDWLAISSAYLGFRSLEYPRVWKNSDGHHITFEDFHDLTTAWVIYNKLEYQIDSSCRTIIDAGANVGMFSLFAASRAPDSKIIALEPFGSTRARLESNIQNNKLSDRVTIRPWALARDDGERYMDDSPAIPSISRTLLAENSSERGIRIPTISLTSLLRKEKLERIDFLKLDIEGSEHEVLLSTPVETLEKIHTIGMEYHHTAPKSTLFRSLIDSGFKLIKDRPTQRDSGIAHFQRP
jgi:FkbM family methyltransferase